MADCIGIPAGSGTPVRNPVGVYAVPNMGWYALWSARPFMYQF
jgi:hypothetical protein